MKQIVEEYRYTFILPVYTVVYLLFFVLIEKINTGNYVILHTRFDDMIPFCEYFVVFYYMWFLYMVASFFYVLKDKATCVRMSVFLMIGMTLFIVVSFIFPNGQDIRMSVFPRDNIFTSLVKDMYAIDTPTNILPSIHVYNSIGAHIAISKCKYTGNRKWIKVTSFVLCVLIILSTLFIKQHSVIDVLAGILLAGVVNLLSYNHSNFLVA